MSIALRFLLPCFVLLAGAAAHATESTGLPIGGGLDANRVVAARYGAKAGPARPAAAAIPAGGITSVTFDSSGAAARQTNVPVTFGQVFAPGDLQKGDALLGRFVDGTSVPLQVDVKATHADRSVRHAIISAVLPQAQAGQLRAMSLEKAGAAGTVPGSAAKVLAPRATPAALLAAGFTASVTATIDGKDYTASAGKLLAQPNPATWISGPVATEWLVSAPLTTAQGQAHPHLAARFAIRWYSGIGKARVDVTVENDWAFQPAPQNFTYDAKIDVGGKAVYTKAGLTHLHHARWRKVFWWGEAPVLHVRHDTRYLIATRALPNYDPSLVVSEAALAGLQAKWSGPKTEPMGVGMAVAYMPTTGGRDDIGLLPGWAALYVISMDKRAKDATLGTADLAGSWSAHYRDQKTGRPVSLLDYPYMTIVAKPGDTFNPATHKYEAFPACASADACKTPYHHDTSHQPGFAYLPYLVTGDYYYLEELQFWGMYDVFSSNPEYRQTSRGLVQSDQVRGQAWSMRTLAEAAYITPDSDPLKAQFTKLVSNNLDWYNASYTNNAQANALGVVVNGYAFSYKDKTGIAPWQDDFFTAAVGHVADLGFTQAAPLLAWKARFPVSRMVGKGTCWILGASYTMVVRDSATSPVYGTIGQVYKASNSPDVTSLPCAGPGMAAALKLKVGEMTGYSDGAGGFPSNMQPALAYAAGVAGQAGKDAWAQFMARSVKPDYSASPQFAIVPR
jgi:hypothetical protein